MNQAVNIGMEAAAQRLGAPHAIDISGEPQFHLAKKEVESVPHWIWNIYDDRQLYPGSPHRDTCSIYLRMPRLITPEAIFNDVEAVDYPGRHGFPEVWRLMWLAAAKLNARRVGRVMLVKLAPRGMIDPHVDEGGYADAFDRFHLILSGTGEYVVDGSHSVLEPGILYWLNVKKVHSVYNPSLLFPGLR